MKVVGIFPVVLFFASQFCAASPPDSASPIIGVWKVAVPGTTCSETYEFKANGTTHVTSADEIGESKFEISSTPSAAGYYKLTDTVVKTNGKKDCSGTFTPIGDKVTLFIHFQPDKKVFSFCYSESSEKCVGPFVRVVSTSP